MQRIGYSWIRQDLGAKALPHFCESYLVSGARKSECHNGVCIESYPSAYQPDETIAGHLEFALRHEGVHFHLIKQALEAWPEQDFVEYVREKPTSKYRRILWFLYETFLDCELPLDAVTQGNYVNLLDDKLYVTTESTRARRQRINVNWLGSKNWCPVIRKTTELRETQSQALDQQIKLKIEAYPESLIRRATNYLYTKETKSSFAIEQIEPSKRRTALFVELLRQAGTNTVLDEKQLTSLQNSIVDERFAETGFRNVQNYVGQTVRIGREIIHCVFPKPQDLRQLMNGLEECATRLLSSKIDPVVVAATLSFGYIYLHPFEDGNGRIHRFLIHDVLAAMNYTPDGIVFPISAAMLNDEKQYDATLEAISKPLMQLVDYDMDSSGGMVVHSETADFYRFLDLTTAAESLYLFLAQTVDNEFLEEIQFLACYDQARKGIQNVVDLPDRKSDLLIKLVLQNKGELSARKRSQFQMLSDEELRTLETQIRSCFSDSKLNSSST